MKRRISHAHASRPSYSGRRVAQVRPRSFSFGLIPVCVCEGNISFFTSASACTRAALVASRAPEGKKSSALIDSNSRRCLCSTREIAAGSATPNPTFRLFTVLVRLS